MRCLLFRMGDFYELFYEDAKTAARELGLSLTSRDKGENPIPMAGFPHHQLDQYLAKLIARGFRAAVCEQMEDPRQAKGIVKREVTRVVSRGTVTDDSLLEPCTANFLLALAASPTKDACGLAWIDVSTGRFEATVTTADRLGDELARVGAGRDSGPRRRRRTAGGVGRRADAHAAADVGLQPRGGRRRADAALRRALARGVRLHRRRRPGDPGGGGGARLSQRDAEVVARARRPADSVSPRDAAGDRRSDAAQPGAHAERSATAGATARCWG